MSGKNMRIMLEVHQEADPGRLPGHEDREGEEKCGIYLTKDTTPEEVDALLKILIGYKLDGNAPKEALLDRLYRKLDRRKLTLPGGICFEGEGARICPGRCSGVEDWVDIACRLRAHCSPYGRRCDLDVFFLEQDGVCYLSDVILTKYPSSDRHSRKCRSRWQIMGIEEALADGSVNVIGWQEEEFHRSLGRLYEDFEGFLNGPLQKRMEQLTGREGGRQFARAFARCFRRHKNVDQDGIRLTV